MAFGDLQAHLTKWRLAPDGEPFETHSSWLCFVKHGHVPALLKVRKPNSDEHRSAAALRHWGDRAVRVFEEDGAATLIERVVPGTPLTELVGADDDRATHIWCDTVAAMHGRPAPDDNWPTLFDCGRALNKPAPKHPMLPAELFEQGKRAFFELAKSQGDTLHLLHTDLHHANVVKDDRRGWLVIDPKGYIGELAFEAAAFLHNPTRAFCTPEHLERRSLIIASRLGLDQERLLRWVLAHGVLSAVWSAEDAVFDPAGGIEAANAALELLGHRKPSLASKDI